MKKRLLAQTFPVSVPLNVLSAEPRGFIQLKHNCVLVTECADASTFDKVPLSINVGSILSFRPELQYTSETFAGAALRFAKNYLHL